MNWLWRGYLAPGQLTLLTSLWKSGKTTLLSILLSRLKDGGELLGLPVRPAKTLLIFEENADLWHWRWQQHIWASGCPGLASHGERVRHMPRQLANSIFAISLCSITA